MTAFCGLCGGYIHGHPFVRATGTYGRCCIRTVESQEARQIIDPFVDWLFAERSGDEPQGTPIQQQIAEDFASATRGHSRGRIYHLFEDNSESSGAYRSDRRTFGMSWSPRKGDVWEPAPNQIDKLADSLLAVTDEKELARLIREHERQQSKQSAEWERSAARRVEIEAKRRIREAAQVQREIREEAERAARATTRKIFLIQRRQERESHEQVARRLKRKVRQREATAQEFARQRSFAEQVFGPKRLWAGVIANRKVTVDDVKAMRLAYDAGLSSTKRLGQQYGVSQATAWQIVTRTTWIGVEPSAPPRPAKEQE